MSLPPILYHYFQVPLPYAPTLALQNLINGIQLAQKKKSKHKDYLLLLQHRPVFTAGRRQLEEEIKDDRLRLQRMGADFESTSRGGQLTYHGPGQIVGYPLIDLGRWRPAMSVRDYVCRVQTTLKKHLLDAHGIETSSSENTGVFADAGKTKLGSIGVEVRHRLTMHGFALNVTREPLAWFDNIVACGLADVRAGCIAGRSKTLREEKISGDGEISGLVKAFGDVFGREMFEMELEMGDEVSDAIAELELSIAQPLHRDSPPSPRPLIEDTGNPRQA